MMPNVAILKKRITVARSLKAELAKAMRKGKLDLDKGNEIATELAERLIKARSLAALDLEFSKMIKDFSVLEGLGTRLEELKKYDLDQEIAELVEKLIEKGDFHKALSLANEVISVYLRNPDINLDDFKQELLKRWASLTKKKTAKMHETVENRKQRSETSLSTSSGSPFRSANQQASQKSHPPEEGQILQAGEVFGAPGTEEYHESGEELGGPKIEVSTVQEKMAKFSESVKKFSTLFKESSKEVSGEVSSKTGSKLKEAALNVLAKGQEVLEKRKEKKN